LKSPERFKVIRSASSAELDATLLPLGALQDAVQQHEDLLDRATRESAVVEQALAEGVDVVRRQLRDGR
jgi:hypothetical protein